MDQILLNLTTSGGLTIGGYVDGDGGYSTDPTRSITDDPFADQFSFVDFDLQDLPSYAINALKSGAAKLQVQFTTSTSDITYVTVNAYASPDDINVSAVPGFIANPNGTTAGYVEAAFDDDGSGSLDSVSVRKGTFASSSVNQNESQTIDVTKQAIAALDQGANLVVYFKGSGGVAGESTNVTNVTASIKALAPEPDSFANDSSTSVVGTLPTKPFATATLTSNIPSSVAQNTSGGTIVIGAQFGIPTSTEFTDSSLALQGTEYFEIVQSNAAAGVLSGAGLSTTSAFIKSGQAGYVLSGTAASVTSALQGLVFTPASGASSLSTPTTFTLYEFDGLGGAPGGAPISAGSVQEATGSTSGIDLDGNYTQIVTSGGTAYATTLDGYGSGSDAGDFIYEGTQIISAGGVASGTIVSAGNVYVYSGGRSVGTNLVSGGRFGIDNQSSVADETVYSGGKASGTSIGEDAVQTISGGGSANGTVIKSGGRQFLLSGASEAGTQVLSGGTDTVSAGAFASSTTISAGGAQNLYGSSSDDEISGVQTVEAGGTALYGGVNSGGVQNVAGTTEAKFVGNGGTQNVLSGGVASGTYVTGVLTNVSGTLIGDTDQIISAGGNAVNAGIGSGGVQAVMGVADNTLVSAGGLEIVESGGVAAATTVFSGGSATVLSGGTLTNAVISGGSVDLQAGAKTSGTITFSGSGNLEIDAPATAGTLAFATPLSGFVFGDTLDLAGLAYASGSMSGTISGSTLTVGNGKASETFTLQGASAQGVVLSRDSQGGTLVTAAAAPTIAGSANISTGVQYVDPFEGAVVTDPNVGTTDTLTIQLSNGGAGGQLLETGLTRGGNGLYTYTGRAADVQNELRRLQFNPTSGQPNGSVTTTFTLTDTTTAGTTTVNSGYSVTVTTQAVLPTIAIVGGGSQTVTSEAVSTPFSGVTVADPNADSTDTVSIQLSNHGSGGTLSGAGLAGGANGLYTLSGTAAQVTSALQVLSFTPAAGQPGASTTTTFTIVDTAVSGLRSKSAVVSVTDVDPAQTGGVPTIVGGGTQTTYSEGAVTPFAGVVISDPNQNSIETLTIQLSNAGSGGVLTGTGLSGGNGGAYALSGTDAQVTSALQALSFTPAMGVAGTSATTTFTLTDASTAGTSAQSTGYDVTDVDPLLISTSGGGYLGLGSNPTIAGGATLTVASEATTSPFAGVTITDPNAGSTDTLTIQLSNAGSGGVLAGSGLAGGTGGTYVLSGTDAQVTSALQALSFTPSVGQANSSATTTFTLTDTTTVGTSATVSGISVTDTDPAVAPTIVGGGTQSVTSEAVSTPFASASITDPNANSTDTLTIQLSNAGSGGTLSGAGLGGGSNGTYVLSGTDAQVTSALQALSFTPRVGQPNGSATTTFTLTDVTTAGTSATVSGTSVIDNDPAVPPTIVGGGTQTVTSEAVSTPFASASITDPNANSIDTLTIQLSNAGSGGVLTGTGLGGRSNGTYVLSGTDAQVTIALQALSFTPTVGQPNTSSTTTFTLTDTTTAGTSTTVAGGSVTNIDPAIGPTVVGGGAQSVTSEAVSTPFASASVTDPNANSTDTLAIQLSNAGSGGILSGAGLSGGTGGTYTLTGTDAQITSALQALDFTPAAGAPGTSATTTFTLTDMTTAGTSATDASTSVTDTDPAVPPTSSTSSTSGHVVDGYIVGATVFEDTDGNGVLDPGEISTTTGADGGFVLPASTAPLVALGGTDTSTGLPNRSTLLAPAGSTVVTPLTTLISKVAALNGGDVAAASAKVTSALGLAIGTNLLTLDPEAGTLAGTAGAAAAYVAGAQVQNTVALLAAGGGSSGYDAVAAAIAGSSGTISLTDAGTLSSIAAAAGVPSSASAAVVAALQSSNAMLAAAGHTSDILGSVAAAQTIAQGTTAATLSAALANATTPSPQPSPSAATDSVSIDPQVSFRKGVFTLTGEVASTAGVAGIEISATVNGRETDLGAATVNADGTFTFSDPIGHRLQGFITATETDLAGGTVTGAATFSLEGGGGTAARQDSYTADGSTWTTATQFRPDGAHVETIEADHQTVLSNAFDRFDTGGHAATTFVFNPGFGRDVIEGFTAGGIGHDRIDLPSADFTGLADVLRNTGEVGGSAVITDPVSGDAIRLAGVSKAELVENKHDIHFHP